MSRDDKTPSQCQKPSGWIGRLTLWSMNRRHTKIFPGAVGSIVLEDQTQVVKAIKN